MEPKDTRETFPDDPEWLTNFECDWEDAGKLTMGGFPKDMPSSMRLYLAAILPKQWPRALEMIMNKEDHSWIGDAEISFSSNWSPRSARSEVSSSCTYSEISFLSDTGDCVEFCARGFPVAVVRGHQFLRIVKKALRSKPGGFLAKPSEKELLQRFREHVDDVCRQARALSTKEPQPQGTEEYKGMSELYRFLGDVEQEKEKSHKTQTAVTNKTGHGFWAAIINFILSIFMALRTLLGRHPSPHNGLCMLFAPTKASPQSPYMLQLHVYIIPNAVGLIQHLVALESVDFYKKWDQETCVLKPGENYHMNVQCHILQGECSSIVNPKGLVFDAGIDTEIYYRKFRVDVKAKKAYSMLTIALQLMDNNNREVCQFQTTINYIQVIMESPDRESGLSTDATILRRNPSGRFAVLLVSHYYGTSKVGSIISRQLALDLIAAGATVYITVLEATEQDERDAEQDGVILIKPFIDDDSGPRPSPEWLTVYHKHHFPHIPPDICCIVGYVDVTSRAARRIKEDRFPGVNLVLFTHKLPKDTRHYQGERKALGITTKDDMARADTVFSVGACVHRQLDRFLCRNGVTHHIFLPKPSKLFTETIATNNQLSETFENLERVILSVCKVQEDLNLVVDAINLVAERLVNYTQRLQIYVIDWKNLEKTKKRVEKKLASGWITPTLLPYDTQEMIQDMQTSHLVLMPSRDESFGLVSLEAIAAGVPVLISEQSGLAELLQDLLDEHEQPKFSECIVKTKRDITADAEKWADCIEDIITNPMAKFTEASNLKDKLLASRYWEESHQQFVQACLMTYRKKLSFDSEAYFDLDMTYDSDYLSL